MCIPLVGLGVALTTGGGQSMVPEFGCVTSLSIVTNCAVNNTQGAIYSCLCSYYLENSERGKRARERERATYM